MILRPLPPIGSPDIARAVRLALPLLVLYDWRSLYSSRKMPVIRAAIYLRSSKDRSDVSIDAQRRQLQQLASERGYLIAAEYADVVESGKDDQRPGFQSLVSAVRNRRRGWDALLILDTSRLARRRHIAELRGRPLADGPA